MSSATIAQAADALRAASRESRRCKKIVDDAAARTIRLKEAVSKANSTYTTTVANALAKKRSVHDILATHQSHDETRKAEHEAANNEVTRLTAALTILEAEHKAAAKKEKKEKEAHDAADQNKGNRMDHEMHDADIPVAHPVPMARPVPSKKDSMAKKSKAVVMAGSMAKAKGARPGAIRKRSKHSLIGNGNGDQVPRIGNGDQVPRIGNGDQPPRTGLAYAIPARAGSDLLGSHQPLMAMVVTPKERIDLTGDDNE